MPEATFKTFCYKVVDDIRIHLDLYPPTALAGPSAIPAVIYFHGGGLTVGNRKSWFPTWLHRRVVDAGYAFISADYRLIPPSTGHDIIADIKDLFSFITNDLNPLLESASLEASSDAPASHPYRIDSQALAVAGSSAGGLCAYLAAIHASPRPVAALCLYAMGGNFVTNHYVAPKSAPFFRGRELLNPDDYAAYLPPFPPSLLVTADSAIAYHDGAAPGYRPANTRMPLAQLYLQLGVFLDYYTGAHVPGLSAVLREALRDTPAADEALTAQIRDAIPVRHQALFPQFSVTPGFPPTYLVHGAQDSAVLADESRHFHGLLERAGVRAQLDIVEGMEHSFDLAEGAEETRGATFDSVLAFLRNHLQPTRN